QFRIRDAELVGHRLDSPGFERIGSTLLASDRAIPAGSVCAQFVGRGRDPGFYVCVRAVFDICQHQQWRGITGYRRRPDPDAPVGDVDRVALHEPDVAVDAAAGVPAGGVGRVVEADGEDVLLAGLEVGSEVDAPGGVAVGPAAGVVAVAPDVGVGHGA